MFRRPRRADDADTLRLSAVKRVPPCSWEAKRRKLASPVNILTDREKDSILERVLDAYEAELEAPIQLTPPARDRRRRGGGTADEGGRPDDEHPRPQDPLD